MASLTDLIPSPVKDVILAPITARRNADLAANRLIRSSFRITIATVGIFSQFILLGMFGSSFVGCISALFFPLAVVCISSMPAGMILIGSGYLIGGAFCLITVLAFEALSLYSIGLNLVMSAFFTYVMYAGLKTINIGNETVSLGKFSGYLEPYISNIAERYQIPVAGFLRRF